LHASIELKKTAKGKKPESTIRDASRNAHGFVVCFPALARELTEDAGQFWGSGSSVINYLGTHAHPAVIWIIPV
jgi:hypothetical protein